MSSPPFVLAAVGDVILMHPISASMIDPASADVLRLLRTAEVAIGNCEFSAFDPSTPGPIPQAESGGLWLNGGPEAIEDLAALGITMVSRANNHAGDFGVAGMEETDRLLSQHRIVRAGTGETLAAARAPAFLATRAGRTALISATDTAPRHSTAGHARDDIKGRPGVNMIRAEIVKVVDATTFHVLQVALSAASAQQYGLGRLAADGQAIHGLGPSIRMGERSEDVIAFVESDVEENLAQVRAARRAADVVVFALHTHLAGVPPGTPPEAVRRFAHRTVEAGADVFVGHGPHRLRGIEIYQGRPIFYSLGNFVWHLTKFGSQPADLYDGVGLDPRRSTLGDLVAHLSREGGELRYVLHDTTVWEGVLARVVHDGTSRRVELHPIELSSGASGSQLGTPKVAHGAEARRILERVIELSAALGTEIRCDDGVGVIECSI